MRTRSSLLRFGDLPAFLLLGAVASAQTTSLVSQDSSAIQGNWNSNLAAMTPDGRYVVFASDAWNLVAGDTNSRTDIFLRDRLTFVTERVSLGAGGVQGDGSSDFAAVSPDGRYVAFQSEATNLVPGDTNGQRDIFVRDRQTGTTERVSVDTGGTEGDFGSSLPSISADGRFVSFYSGATNLVPGDTNGVQDVFVRDRQTPATERVSISTGGVQGDSHSASSRISPDGRYVVFAGWATNLVPGDTNGAADVFLRDRQNATTERVSLANDGSQADNYCQTPWMSDDARYVAFASEATNLLPGDVNLVSDIYLRDRQAGTTERISVSTGGTAANYGSLNPSLSADGRLVAFQSMANNLVPFDTNATFDEFVRDRVAGTTVRASIATGGFESDDQSNYVVIAGDGRFVAFDSLATNLVSGDANASRDVFLHDLDPTGFSSSCDPGTGGVAACPCANPPSGSGRGCNNSSATGGAILAASGEAYLSADSLVFTTSGERPTATSIVLQGTVTASAGIVYGQGVRCVAGILKRLYTKSAVAGSVTAPDWSVFDPPVSTRSAAKGDLIQAGQSRWYLVFYRDPNVLGGCPATSTFNATQTGRVTWWW